MADAFGMYARMWAYATFWVHKAGEVPFAANVHEYAFNALLVAIFCCPHSGRLLLSGHVFSVYVGLMIIPNVFDEDMWMFHMDIVFIAAAIHQLGKSAISAEWSETDRGAVWTVACPIIRVQSAIFYSGAFIWKLNTAFFDTRGNCSVVFFLSIDCR